MNTIWTPKGLYRKKPFESEPDFENTIFKVQESLFGPNRIYLPVKKKIGVKGGIRNIPDGYLIDLTGQTPRLYVVENELAAHDPLRHIAVQILQFSLSFESEGLGIKSLLLNALQEQPGLKAKCETYAVARQFRNLDHLLEHLVFASPFSALIIIDELPENLENILIRKFQFGVEVLELARYVSKTGEFMYQFEPFLEDVTASIPPEGTDVPPIPPADIDTLVVPGRPDGVQETFLGENRWYEIRIHGSMKPQIKYIALYQVAPISAITHLAPVKSIEPWKDTGKYVVNFAEPAKAIGPIPLVKGGRVRAMQNIRYTILARLKSAKSLDDIW